MLHDAHIILCPISTVTSQALASRREVLRRLHAIKAKMPTANLCIKSAFKTMGFACIPPYVTV